MNTQEIRLELPSDIFLSLNESESELKKNIKISFALRQYRLQKLTIGKAAQVSGLSRYEFENLLAENNIPVSNLTVDDVFNDTKKLK